MNMQDKNSFTHSNYMIGNSTNYRGDPSTYKTQNATQ